VAWTHPGVIPIRSRNRPSGIIREAAASGDVEHRPKDVAAEHRGKDTRSRRYHRERPVWDDAAIPVESLKGPDLADTSAPPRPINSAARLAAGRG